MIVRSKMHMVAITVGPFVATGLYFETLTPAEKAAVIAHERGHQRHSHTAKRIWWLLSGSWKHLGARCRAQELEADRYAVLQGHGDGLVSFLARTLMVLHESPLHPTARERIDNIRRWMQCGSPA